MQPICRRSNIFDCQILDNQPYLGIIVLSFLWYSKLRQPFWAALNGLFNTYPNFKHCGDSTRLTTHIYILMSDEYVKSTAKIILECFIVKSISPYDP